MVAVRRFFLLWCIVISVLLLYAPVVQATDPGQEQPLKYSFGFEADFDQDVHALVVTAILPDSSAAHAGLQPGDYIIAIDYSPDVIGYLYYATRLAQSPVPRVFTIVRSNERSELSIAPDVVVPL